MKGASFPAVVIMLSPLFLWRFKAIVSPTGLMLLQGWNSVMRISVDLRDLFLYEAFLYYNPLLLVCATWLILTVPTSMTAYLYLYMHGESVSCIISTSAITFPDFFLADTFTSMSKVFSDLERSVCRQVATIAWFEADSICGSHSIAIPLVLVFPYLCCFFQCLRQYKDTKEKSCLLNGVLYWVLGSNLVLRCTWTYKLSVHLRHNYLTVFTIAALEILRWWQWVFFRVENEWNRMSAKQNLEMSSNMPPKETGYWILVTIQYELNSSLSFCSTDSSPFF